MTKEDADKDNELEPIRLVESEVAMDLLERYRVGANCIGSIELAKHISIEVSKVAGVRGIRISKSMIDSWRAGRSAPTAEHLPSLHIFFRSKRFRRIVPNATYLWDSLSATTDLGLHLLNWEGGERNGTMSELDGLWSDHSRFKTSSRVDPGRCFRFASIGGQSFSVAHFVPTVVTDSPVILEAPYSGFLFQRKNDYLLVLRNRANRVEEVRGLVRKISDRKGDTGIRLVISPLENTLSTALRIKEDAALTRGTDSPGLEEIRKLFDSILWSVLPNA